MKEYIIDGSKFSTYENAYIEIKSVLSEGTEKKVLSIREIVKKYISGDNITVVWMNSNKSKKDLGYEETIKYLKKRLQTVPLHELVPTLQEIKKAEEFTGPTMFDKIIEAFEVNDVTVDLR